VGRRIAGGRRRDEGADQTPSKELADSYSKELADSYVDETLEAYVDETPER